MEFGDSCFISVWGLPDMKCVTQLGDFRDTFVFDMKISQDSNNDILHLIAATINTVDIWEWQTWRHLTRIKDLVDVNQCLLCNDKLLVGDVYGRVGIWQKIE